MRPLDDHSFRALFLEQRPSLLRFLRRLTRSETLAEDLLQDTFLRVWRKRHQFEGRGAAEGFLRKAAYRVFLNHREREQRRLRLADRGPFGAADGSDREPVAATGPVLAPPADREPERRDSLQFLLGRLEQALAGLPEEPRRVFVLFRFEELSLKEIAELTSAPVKTVESRLRRATELLAARLRPLEGRLPE